MRMKRWKRYTEGMLAAGLGLVMLSPVFGEAPDEALGRHGRTIDAVAARSTGQERVAGWIAADLNAACQCQAYSAESVAAQRAQNGWGWGEVVIADKLALALVPGILAQNPALTPAQALALATASVTTARQSMGWGAIAKANGLRLGEVVSKVAETASAAARGPKDRDTAPGTSGLDVAGKSAKGNHGDAATGRASEGSRGPGDRGDRGGSGGPGGGGGGGGGAGGSGGKK
jgi:uncharacterized membrane protein YgcG